MLVLGIMVAVGGVVVETGEGVMVEAGNVKIVLNFIWRCHRFINSPEVKSVVICAEQQTTAMNPLAVPKISELNLTVMVEKLVKGLRLEPQKRSCWMEDPSSISILSV